MHCRKLHVLMFHVASFMKATLFSLALKRYRIGVKHKKSRAQRFNIFYTQLLGAFNNYE